MDFRFTGGAVVHLSEQESQIKTDMDAWEVNMARLHSLLSKSKIASSDPETPKEEKSPRGTPFARKDLQPTADTKVPVEIALDSTPPGSPSRADQISKPSPRLTREKWRLAAMLEYHEKAAEIRAQPNTPNRDIFPFLALPAELRMAVYFELLVTDDRVLPTWRGPRKATKQQKKMHIAILQTCRLCRDEGVGVLYGENIFDFGEICHRPNNFCKRFVNHVGMHNAALIRIVFAEYAAAAEELLFSEADAGALSETNPSKKTPTNLLTVEFLRSFLSGFNISLSSLRMLAISIMPYGNDLPTQFLLQKPPHARDVQSATSRVIWLEDRNERGKLRVLARGICEREKGFEMADYWADVDGWFGITFAPPSSGREWIVYRGVRGREEGRSEEEEKVEEEKVEEEKVEEEKVEDESAEGDEKATCRSPYKPAPGDHCAKEGRRRIG